MSRFSKYEVTGRLLDTGLLPVFYHGDAETAKRIVEACVRGGVKAIEFTNRGDRACHVFGELAKFCGRLDVALGAGTIVDQTTAGSYINEGADFIVGPIFNPEVARICNRRKVVYIPGCSTPSEISAAEEGGADIVKVFPASVMGPEFIKAVLGPSPSARLMPSGGVDVTKESVSEWVKAGAVALNIGKKLVSGDLVKAGNFDEIQKRVEQILLWVREARG